MKHLSIFTKIGRKARQGGVVGQFFKFKTTGLNEEFRSRHFLLDQVIPKSDLIHEKEVIAIDS